MTRDSNKVRQHFIEPTDCSEFHWDVVKGQLDTQYVEFGCDTIAILKTPNGYFCGRARCHKSDKYRPTTGRYISTARAVMKWLKSIK